MEGSTMPMIFFTVLGVVQCAIWMISRDRVRWGLGLTLLFGAAMTTFQGFITLGLVGGCILLIPRCDPHEIITIPLEVVGFCLLTALPFAAYEPNSFV